MSPPSQGGLDDRGENGMDLVANIKKMYEVGDGHVFVLAASIRQLDHLLGAFALQAELASAPAKVWEESAKSTFSFTWKGFRLPGPRQVRQSAEPHSLSAA